MIERTEAAARRGVQVRLFVPGKANNLMCATAQRAGTGNLEAWSLKRFFEIDLHVRSPAVAAMFDERFSAPRRGRLHPRPGADRSAPTTHGRRPRCDLATSLTALSRARGPSCRRR